MLNIDFDFKSCPWGDNLTSCAITVCDLDGVVLYQNKRSIDVNGDVRGKSMLPCHSARSREIIQRLITEGTTNAYTIQKGSLRKLNQFSSYYLSLHIFHLSTTHKEILGQYLLCSIPLLLIGAFYLVKAFINGSRAESIAFVAAILLAVFGYALSQNTQSVFMLLIPLFASITALDTKTSEQVGGFFAKRLLLLLLTVGISVCAPMLLGTLPYDTELFSKATFIIFREQ